MILILKVLQSKHGFGVYEKIENWNILEISKVPGDGPGEVFRMGEKLKGGIGECGRPC